MADHQSEIKEKNYINCDINRLKPKIFESLTKEEDFETWLSELPLEKQIQIEERFNRLNQVLTQKLYQKKLITQVEQEKISSHIAKVTYRIVSETKHPETQKDLKIFNGLKKSAQEILQTYNQFVALNWIQTGFANNYTFQSLVQEIALKYAGKERELEELCKVENFLSTLVNFGFYAGDQSKAINQMEIHTALSELFGKKNVDKAFVQAKKTDQKTKNEVLGQMINLVVKNHPKKLVMMALLTLFESSTGAPALNNLIISLPVLDFDSALMAASVLVGIQLSSQLVGYLENKIDILNDLLQALNK